MLPVKSTVARPGPTQRTLRPGTLAGPAPILFRQAFSVTGPRAAAQRVAQQKFGEGSEQLLARAGQPRA